MIRYAEIVASLLTAAGIGALLALGSIAMAGAGHGSLWPGVLFFGMAVAVAVRSEGLFLVCGALLYALYAASFYHGVCRRRTIATLVIELVFHFGSVLSATALFRRDLFFDPVTHLSRVWDHQAAWAVSSGALFVVFIGLCVCLACRTRRLTTAQPGAT